MDKYEYRVKTVQMQEFVQNREYSKAMAIADTIDWNRVKNADMLCAVSEIYEFNGQFNKSRNILFIAYDRAPENRKIVYRLGILALKLGDASEAMDCYEEFLMIAPKDPNQYILRYKILKVEGASLAQQIEALERFKKIEYVERWAYELAVLYHNAGMTAECLAECDDLILWFGEGKHVYQAMELKMRYKALTRAQQEKYNSYAQRNGIIPSPIPTQVEVEKTVPGQEQYEVQEEVVSDRTTVIDEEELQAIREATEQLNGNSGEFAGSTVRLDVAAVEQELVKETEVVEEAEVVVETEAVVEVEAVSEPEVVSEPEKVKAVESIIPSTVRSRESRDAASITGQLRIEEILKGWEQKQAEMELAIADEKARADAAAEAEAIQKAQEEALRQQEEEKARALAAQKPTPILPDDIRQLMEDIENGVESKFILSDDEIEEREHLPVDNKGEIVDHLLVEEYEDELEYEDEEDEYEEELEYEDEEDEYEDELEYEDEEDEYEEELEYEDEEDGYEDELEYEDEEDELEYEDEEDEYEDELEYEDEEDEYEEVQDEYEEEQDEYEEEQDEYEEEQDEYDDEYEDEYKDEFLEDEDDEMEGQLAFDFEAMEAKVEAAVEDDEDDFDEPSTFYEKEEMESAFDIYESEEEERMKFEQDLETPGENMKVLSEERVAPSRIEMAKAVATGRTAKLPTAEIARAVAAGGKIGQDTGFIVQARYDLDTQSEVGLRAGLTEEQKKLFSYFVPVRGMSEQLVDVLERDKHCSDKNGASITGNLLVIGHKGSGKTVLAVDVVKAIQKNRNIRQGKVAIVTGEALNKKKISDIIGKLYGGALIIEKANGMNEKTVIRLNKAMERDTGELLVVLEDQRKPLDNLLASNMEFRKKFTSRLEVPVFINDELVTFGQAYAKENEYRIDEMGILALYSRIDSLQRDDHAVTVAEVKDIIDDAIDHSKRLGVKLLAKKLFRKGDDNDGRIVLTEKNFNN